MSGYGAVIAFAVRGGYETTSRFVSALEVPTQAVSLGGVDSLAVHTAAMWAGTMNEAQMQAAGIPANFVRFSVGHRAHRRPHGGHRPGAARGRLAGPTAT